MPILNLPETIDIDTDSLTNEQRAAIKVLMDGRGLYNPIDKKIEKCFLVIAKEKAEINYWNNVFDTDGNVLPEYVVDVTNEQKQDLLYLLGVMELALQELKLHSDKLTGSPIEDEATGESRPAYISEFYERLSAAGKYTRIVNTIAGTDEEKYSFIFGSIMGAGDLCLGRVVKLLTCNDSASSSTSICGKMKEDAGLQGIAQYIRDNISQIPNITTCFLPSLIDCIKKLVSDDEVNYCKVKKVISAYSAGGRIVNDVTNDPIYSEVVQQIVGSKKLKDHLEALEKEAEASDATRRITKDFFKKFPEPSEPVVNPLVRQSDVSPCNEADFINPNLFDCTDPRPEKFGKPTIIGGPTGPNGLGGAYGPRGVPGPAGPDGICDCIPPVVGACCTNDFCRLLTQEQCIQLDGEYYGDNTSCEFVFCSGCASNSDCTFPQICCDIQPATGRGECRDANPECGECECPPCWCEHTIDGECCPEGYCCAECVDPQGCEFDDDCPGNAPYCCDGWCQGWDCGPQPCTSNGDCGWGWYCCSDGCSAERCDDGCPDPPCDGSCGGDGDCYGGCCCGGQCSGDCPCPPDPPDACPNGDGDCDNSVHGACCGDDGFCGPCPEPCDEDTDCDVYACECCVDGSCENCNDCGGAVICAPGQECICSWDGEKRVYDCEWIGPECETTRDCPIGTNCIDGVCVHQSCSCNWCENSDSDGNYYPQGAPDDRAGQCMCSITEECNTGCCCPCIGDANAYAGQDGTCCYPDGEDCPQLCLNCLGGCWDDECSMGCQEWLDEQDWYTNDDGEGFRTLPDGNTVPFFLGYKRQGKDLFNSTGVEYGKPGDITSPPPDVPYKVAGNNEIPCGCIPQCTSGGCPSCLINGVLQCCDEHCCGGVDCCPFESCCNGVCCPDGQVCCGDSCCDASSCCGNQCCDGKDAEGNPNEQCCPNQSHCCSTEQNCCGDDKCCEDGHECCGLPGGEYNCCLPDQFCCDGVCSYGNNTECCDDLGGTLCPPEGGNTTLCCCKEEGDTECACCTKNNGGYECCTACCDIKCGGQICQPDASAFNTDPPCFEGVGCNGTYCWDCWQNADGDTAQDLFVPGTTLVYVGGCNCSCPAGQKECTWTGKGPNGEEWDGLKFCCNNTDTCCHNQCCNMQNSQCCEAPEADDNGYLQTDCCRGTDCCCWNDTGEGWNNTCCDLENRHSGNYHTCCEDFESGQVSCQTVPVDPETGTPVDCPERACTSDEGTTPTYCNSTECSNVDDNVLNCCDDNQICCGGICHDIPETATNSTCCLDVWGMETGEYGAWGCCPYEDLQSGKKPPLVDENDYTGCPCPCQCQAGNATMAFNGTGCKKACPFGLLDKMTVGQPQGGHCGEVINADIFHTVPESDNTACKPCWTLHPGDDGCGSFEGCSDADEYCGWNQIGCSHVCVEPPQICTVGSVTCMGGCGDLEGGFECTYAKSGGCENAGACYSKGNPDSCGDAGAGVECCSYYDDTSACGAGSTNYSSYPCVVGEGCAGVCHHQSLESSYMCPSLPTSNYWHLGCCPCSYETYTTAETCNLEPAACSAGFRSGGDGDRGYPGDGPFDKYPTIDALGKPLGWSDYHEITNRQKTYDDEGRYTGTVADIRRLTPAEVRYNAELTKEFGLEEQKLQVKDIVDVVVRAERSGRDTPTFKEGGGVCVTELSIKARGYCTVGKIDCIGPDGTPEVNHGKECTKGYSANIDILEKQRCIEAHVGMPGWQDKEELKYDNDSCSWSWTRRKRTIGDACDCPVDANAGSGEGWRTIRNSSSEYGTISWDCGNNPCTGCENGGECHKLFIDDTIAEARRQSDPPPVDFCSCDIDVPIRGQGRGRYIPLAKPLEPLETTVKAKFQILNFLASDGFKEVVPKMAAYNFFGSSPDTLVSKNSSRTTSRMGLAGAEVDGSKAQTITGEINVELHSSGYNIKVPTMSFVSGSNIRLDTNESKNIIRINTDDISIKDLNDTNIKSIPNGVILWKNSGKWTYTSTIPTGPTGDQPTIGGTGATGGIVFNRAGDAVSSSVFTFDQNAPYYSRQILGVTASVNLNYGFTAGGTASIEGNTFGRPTFKDTAEVKNITYGVDGVKNAVVIDFDMGNVQSVECTGGGAAASGFFPLLNLAATGEAKTIQLFITNGGLLDYSSSDLVFNGKWAGGTAPALSTNGIDIMTIMNINDGTTYGLNYCFLNGEGMTS